MHTHTLGSKNAHHCATDRRRLNPVPSTAPGSRARIRIQGKVTAAFPVKTAHMSFVVYSAFFAYFINYLKLNFSTKRSFKNRLTKQLTLMVYNNENNFNRMPRAGMPVAADGGTSPGLSSKHRQHTKYRALINKNRAGGRAGARRSAQSALASDVWSGRGAGISRAVGRLPSRISKMELVITNRTINKYICRYI